MQTHEIAERVETAGRDGAAAVAVKLLPELTRVMAKSIDSLSREFSQDIAGR